MTGRQANEKAPQGAFSQPGFNAQSIAYLRILRARLEIEGRAIHDPSDRADHREMMNDLDAHIEALKE